MFNVEEHFKIFDIVMAAVIESATSMEGEPHLERFGTDIVLNRCFVDLIGADPGDFVMRLAATPQVQLPQLSTSNIRRNEEEDCDMIKLGSDYLPAPMGGISFGVNPVLSPGEVASAMAVEVHVKFPAEFQWNQGGYLPGIYGVYTSLEGTSAAAPIVFESRWRWDARGKLGIMTRKATTDMNEWVAVTDSKVSIAREVWYCLSVAVHVDGKIHGRVNGIDVHEASCAAGLKSLTGAKVSVYCVDNVDVESMEIAMKGLHFAGYVDQQGDT